jgi:hypothetical protein
VIDRPRMAFSDCPCAEWHTLGAQQVIPQRPDHDNDRFPDHPWRVRRTWLCPLDPQNNRTTDDCLGQEWRAYAALIPES